jgi:AraC-like DNA-binding protein
MGSWPTDPGATVEWGVAAEGIDKVLTVAPPDTALRAGAEMSARALSLVGLVMMSAPTVRALIEAGMRFSQLGLSGLHNELVEQGDEALVRFEPPPASPAVQRAVIEFVLSFVVNLAKEVHQQQGHIRRVRVHYTAPEHAEAYTRFLGCEVQFEAPFNSWSIDRRDLDVSLPGGDPSMFAMLCQRAEQAIAQRQNAASLALRIKCHLRTANLEESDVARVAAHFKMSVTALQRKLKDEGTSFSDLMDEIRRELALESVLQEDVSLKELSERLGFSEPSAFHRAFRRWTGETTRAYRARRLSGGS